MVYGSERNSTGVLENVMSSGEVIKELKITKQTLYKWVLLKRIKAITHELGNRVYLEFDPKEVARIKASMKKNPEPGKSLLKD